MEIKLSSLPPELRRLVLAQTGRKAPAGARPKSPPAPQKARLTRVCSCLFEIFRPDNLYPDRCDGCGAEWPSDR